MPASPARALRGRVRRLAAGVCASALVFTPAAVAADREITVSVAAPQTWQGRTALSTALFDPATLTPCGGSHADVCDTTLVKVEGPGTLSLAISPRDPGTGDVDLYVHRPDAFGLPGPLVAASVGSGPNEAVDLPGASGSYVVAAVSFTMGALHSPGGVDGTATLAERGATPPDADRPRGRQDALVSDPRAGAASQPVVAVSPRDRDVLVAAYRVFADPAAYVSRIATAVSFDRGRHWVPLGAVSTATAANPALAFNADGDALLVANEQTDSWGLTLRRWGRPSMQDVLRRRTWEAPVGLSVPPTGAVDERPVLAADRHDAVMACWARTVDLGAYGRQAVLCRASGDGGATWAAPTQPSQQSAPNVPYGPYVGGVALARRRGVFTVAWVDTLSGVLDASGLDSAWVARSDDGPAWRAPVRAARFRPLPDRFAGDTFRNVTLLSLGGRRERLYLAFAADAAGQADVRLVRSDDAGAHWGEPVTVGTGVRDQFQPSVAVNPRRPRPRQLPRPPAGPERALRRRVAGKLARRGRDAGRSDGSRTTRGIPPSARLARPPATSSATIRRSPRPAARSSRSPPTRTWRSAAIANCREPNCPSCSRGRCALSPLLTGGARSVRGVKERIDELAKRLTELRDGVLRRAIRWSRTRSSTRSRTSCGR